MTTYRDGPPKGKRAGVTHQPVPNHINPSRHATTDSNANTGSRQVTWETVHEYIERVVTTSGFPMVGTAAWSALPDDDERKVAAVYDAAQHWALYIENNQRALADASRAVSAACDWPAVARSNLRRGRAITSGAYIPRVTT